jgi:hypothetical protein
MSESDLGRKTTAGRHGTHRRTTGTTGTTGTGGHTTGGSHVHGSGTTHKGETGTRGGEKNRRKERKDDMKSKTLAALIGLTVGTLLLGSQSGFAAAGGTTTSTGGETLVGNSTTIVTQTDRTQVGGTGGATIQTVGQGNAITLGGDETGDSQNTLGLRTITVISDTDNSVCTFTSYGGTTGFGQEGYKLAGGSVSLTGGVGGGGGSNAGLGLPADAGGDFTRLFTDIGTSEGTTTGGDLGSFAGTRF